MTTFAEKLKQARRERGLSQGQVAKKVGVHRLTVAKIEQGLIAEPGWETVQALSRALGVSCEAFRTDEGA